VKGLPIGPFDRVGDVPDDGVEARLGDAVAIPGLQRRIRDAVVGGVPLDGSGFGIDREQHATAVSGSREHGPGDAFDALGVDVTAEDHVDVAAGREPFVAPPEMRQRDDVVDAPIAEGRNGRAGRLDRIRERDAILPVADRRRRRIGEPEEANPVAADALDTPRIDADEGLPVAPDVGREPPLWGSPDDLGGPVRSEIEIVVAERLEVRGDGLEKVERDRPLRDQREYSGGDVVAGPTEQRVRIPERLDRAGQTGDGSRLVVGVFDV
jgi:hypothetical protein